MDQYVSISSDRGGEVGVKGSSKPVVVELTTVKVSRTEVRSFVHAPGRHYPHQLIEKLVIFAGDLIQTISQLSGSFKVQLVAHVTQDFLQRLQLSWLGRRVPSQNT